MNTIIQQNLKEIKQNIEKACKEAKRNPKDIKIVGVTKTIETDKMKILQNLEISDFGENKAQELLKKYDDFENINWHFIGNLQTNKVKQIIDKVDIIHSVNSLRLLEEIQIRAKNINKKMDILLEINIAYEKTKAGFLEEDIEEILQKTYKYPNIRVKGLMCIAPFVENPRENRKYFAKMNKLFVDIKQKNYDNIDMKYLSMGMTNDYYFAILEGANIIRIGTGIFGERTY